MVSQAMIPNWIERSSNRVSREMAALFGGAFYLVALAQVSIPLPFTPVPITGQTFGVATLALLWGSKRAPAVFSIYIAEGGIGLPVFAQLKSGAQLGPTSGYLAGMLVACYVVGKLSDRGASQSFGRSFFACVLGSACVFTFGLIGLSFFVPMDGLFISGPYPFLPGDLIKNTLAASIVSTLSRRTK